MSLTRAQAEALIVDRCEPWMTKAKMAVTKDGANAALNDPLRQALRQTGYTVADPLLVTDGDLAALDLAADLDEFLDRAELRVLKTCQRRYAKPSTMIEGIQTMNSDLMRQLTEIVRQVEAQVNASWGRAGGGLGMGILSLDFAQAEPNCDEND